MPATKPAALQDLAQLVVRGVEPRALSLLKRDPDLVERLISEAGSLASARAMLSIPQRQANLSRATTIETLRGLAALGERVTPARLFRLGEMSVVRATYRHFGSFPAARLAAGLAPPPRQPQDPEPPQTAFARQLARIGPTPAQVRRLQNAVTYEVAMLAAAVSTLTVRSVQVRNAAQPAFDTAAIARPFADQVVQLVETLKANLLGMADAIRRQSASRLTAQEGVILGAASPDTPALLERLARDTAALPSALVAMTKRHGVRGRKLDLLVAIAYGVPRMQLGRLLGLTENTIKTHIRKLLLQVGAKHVDDIALALRTMPSRSAGPRDQARKGERRRRAKP